MKQPLKDKLELIAFIVSISMATSIISVALFFGMITGILNIYPLAVFWGVLCGSLIVISILSDFIPTGTPISKKDGTDNSNRCPLKYLPFQCAFKVLNRWLPSNNKTSVIKGNYNHIHTIINKTNNPDNLGDLVTPHAPTLPQEKESVNQNGTLPTSSVANNLD